MTEESLNSSIIRISRYFNQLPDAMHGFIITSNDTIFVSYDGRFIFKTAELAKRVFYNDVRNLCYDDIVHDDSYTYNRCATTKEWNEVKKRMNIKIVEI